MSKTVVRAALVGVVAYLLFLAGTLPAALVIPARLPGGVVLAGLSGSLWTGRAAAVVWRDRTVGRLDWHFAPMALLHARLGARFKLDGAGLQAEGEVLQAWFSRRPALSDVDLNLNATVLDRFGMPVVLSGVLRARFERAVWPADGVPQVTGTATWTQAAVKAPFDLSFGAVEAEFRPSQQRQKVSFTLQGGDMAGSGEADIDAKLRYHATADLTARTAAAKQLLGLMDNGVPRPSLHVDKVGRILS